MDAASWIEIAKQIPALGVLVWLVHQFLGHLKAEGQANRNTKTAEVEAMNKLAEAVHQLKGKLD